MFDIPGGDDEFNYFDMDVVTFISTLDVLVVIYSDTISYTDKITRVALALGKQVIFLRNKIDLNADDEDPWQDVVAKDRQELAKNFGSEDRFKVFGVSAKNAVQAAAAARDTPALPMNEPQRGEVQLYEWNSFRRHLADLVALVGRV